MGHSAGGTAVEHHSGKDVRGVAASCDYGSLRSIGRSPGTVCPSGTEFAYRTVGGPAYAGSLCGNRHLVVHYAEHRRFKYLSLDQRSFHNDDRLVREGYLALSHSIDIPCEFHSAQIAPELLVLISGKELLKESGIHIPKILNHFDDLVSSAYHSPVVVFRSLSVEKIEDGHLVFHSIVVEGLSHSVLVLVRAICVVQHFFDYLCVLSGPFSRWVANIRKKMKGPGVITTSSPSCE